MKACPLTALLCVVFFAMGGASFGAAAYWYGTAKGYERIIGDMQQRTMVK